MKYQLILISLFLRSSLQIIKSGPSKIPCPNSCECFIAEPDFLFSGGLAVSCKPNNSSIPQIHPTVTYLDLSGWNITTLDANTFRKTKSIEILILKGSHIKRIENGTFSGMENLNYLNLYGNELTTISVGAFSNPHNNTMTIDLGHNPWNCDCALWNNLESMRENMSMNWFGVLCEVEVEESNMDGNWNKMYKKVPISETWACGYLADLLYYSLKLFLMCFVFLFCVCEFLKKTCKELFRDGYKMVLRSQIIQVLVSPCRRTKENSHQIVIGSSNPSGSGLDFGKMLYGIGEIIGQVRASDDRKSLKKIFSNQVVFSEHCAKKDPSYHYFKLLQLLKKEYSDEELKKFADQLYEEIDDEDFKEIIGVLVLKFWSLVYGIVKDKLYSQNPRNTRGEQDRGLLESALETNVILPDSDDNFYSIGNLRTDTEQAAENGKLEKWTLLDHLMAALHEAFNPRGCLSKYQKRCPSPLQYLCKKIFAAFFGRCFKNSKKCRSCYRATKPVHKGFGSIVYAIFVVSSLCGIVSTFWTVISTIKSSIPK